MFIEKSGKCQEKGLLLKGKKEDFRQKSKEIRVCSNLDFSKHQKMRFANSPQNSPQNAPHDVLYES